MIDATLANTTKRDNYFGNVLIIGLGMIGGSFAKALKSRELAYLYGADRRQDELKLGVATGVIDEAVDLTMDNIQKMDVILLATPVRAMEAVLQELKPLLSEHTLVTDVGSTKGSVINAAKSVFGYVPTNFIPGHPIAGAEKSGVLAANENLFEQHKVILTPQFDSDPTLLNKLHHLWSSIGSEVLSMDVHHHDAVLANSSHLPHLLAYTLVDALANDELSQDVFKFAAGGFRDFTRIASSDPTMWRDVFLANKAATLASLDHFTDRLEEIRQFIDDEDGPAMFGVFTRAKSARDHFLRLQKNNALLAPSKKKSIRVLSTSLIKGAPELLGDKCFSHAMLVMSALADGVSELKNIDQSASTKITLQALQDMGVVIEHLSSNCIRVHGVGRQGLKAPIAPIDIQHSELSLYVLLPILVKQNFAIKITADEALLHKPFTALVELIRSMGGELLTANAECLPFQIEAKFNERSAYDVITDIDSDQIELALLVASALSSGNVNVESHALVKKKNNFLDRFNVFQEEGEKHVNRELVYKAANFELPSDATKLSWVMLLGVLLPGASLSLKDDFFMQRKAAYLNSLLSANAGIEMQSDGLHNIAFSPLKAFHISKLQLALLRDEVLLLCVAAVYAEGKSKIEGITSLPYDWQDRISVFVEALASLNVVAKLEEDYLEIDGAIPTGGELDCAGDYFLALAMLALGVRSRAPVVVHDCQKLFEEFEEFEAVIEQIGFHCQVASQ